MTPLFVPKEKLEKVVSDLNKDIEEFKFGFVNSMDYKDSWYLIYLDKFSRIAYSIADVHESLYGEIVFKTTKLCPVIFEDILKKRLEEK